jgi:hypothetical protein
VLAALAQPPGSRWPGSSAPLPVPCTRMPSVRVSSAEQEAGRRPEQGVGSQGCSQQRPAEAPGQAGPQPLLPGLGHPPVAVLSPNAAAGTAALAPAVGAAPGPGAGMVDLPFPPVPVKVEATPAVGRFVDFRGCS